MNTITVMLFTNNNNGLWLSWLGMFEFVKTTMLFLLLLSFISLVTFSLCWYTTFVFSFALLFISLMYFEIHPFLVVAFFALLYFFNINSLPYIPGVVLFSFFPFIMNFPVLPFMVSFAVFLNVSFSSDSVIFLFFCNLLTSLHFLHILLGLKYSCSSV